MDILEFAPCFVLCNLLHYLYILLHSKSAPNIERWSSKITNRLSMLHFSTCSLSCCSFYWHKKFAFVGRRSAFSQNSSGQSDFMCMFGQKPKQCTISPLMWLWLCLCVKFVVLSFDRAQFSMCIHCEHCKHTCPAHSTQSKMEMGNNVLNYFCAQSAVDH